MVIAPVQAVGDKSAPRSRVVHAWLPADLYEILHRAAEHRSMHVDALATEIIRQKLEQAAE